MQDTDRWSSQADSDMSLRERLCVYILMYTYITVVSLSLMLLPCPCPYSYLLLLLLGSAPLLQSRLPRVLQSGPYHIVLVAPGRSFVQPSFPLIRFLELPKGLCILSPPQPSPNPFHASCTAIVSMCALPLYQGLFPQLTNFLQSLSQVISSVGSSTPWPLLYSHTGVRTWQFQLPNGCVAPINCSSLWRILAC